MKKNILFGLAILATFVCKAQDTRYFEMRQYTVHEGKMQDLIARFDNHTLDLFEKHGIENVAYLLPTNENAGFLTFILAYPDKESRDKYWQAFANDPEWQKVHKESEANGPLVKKVDQTFMTVAPQLSPDGINMENTGNRVFELRTYTMYPGRVENINARFRDHTRALFEKHGMTNMVYWFSEAKEGQQSKLVYLLAHESEASGKASFSNFGQDPAWVSARDASESDGKIVEKVESVYFNPLSFSPLK